MKKIIAILLTAVMICGTTACGNNKADGDSVTDSQIASGEPVTLRLLTYETGVEAAREAVEPFMKEHPEMNIEVVGAADFVAMNQNAIAAHQANDDYDVMFVNHVDTLAYVKGDIIKSIEEYIKRDQIDYSSILFESLLEQGMSNGETYALPVNTGTRVLAVNRDLFEKYGLDYPTTQKEMLEAAEKLTIDGNFGYVGTMTEHCYVPTYEQGIFLAGNGGKLYEMVDGRAVATINTPEMKDFLNFNVELLQYMPKDSLTMNGDDARKAFASGNIGMYKFGNWEYEQLPETSFEYELVKVPKGSKEQASTSGGFQLAMGSGTNYSDEAWELIKYLTTEADAMTILAGTDLPVMEACYETEPYNDPKYDIFREQLETAYLTGIPVPNMNEVSEEFFRHWTDLLYGKITVDEMCVKAQESVQALLDKYNG